MPPFKKLLLPGFLVLILATPSLSPVLGALSLSFEEQSTPIEIVPETTDPINLDQESLTILPVQNEETETLVGENPTETTGSPTPTEIETPTEPLVETVAEESLIAESEVVTPIAVFDPNTSKLDLANFSKKLSQIADKSGDFSVSSLEQDFQKIQTNLSALRQSLESKNIAPTILARLDAFQNQYESEVSPILEKIRSGNDASEEIKKFLEEPEVKIENPAPFRATVFKGEIKKVSASEFPKTALEAEGDLIKDLISSATLKAKSIFNPEPETSNPQPLTSNDSILTSDTQPQTSNTSSPSDLEESEEIQFTENLKNLAVSLQNDPLTIFNYVANNINYIPYFGSKKGADSTLLEKHGNDFDQASLLIGLLRVGDANGQNKIPSRYKQATVKLSVGEVMDLLGVEDAIVAATIFEKTDVPYVLYVDQNQTPLFFVVEITYVEAYIDYDYTRGVVQGNPGAQKRWIPLVPFLAKFYKSQHLNALSEMNFNAETFFDNYLNGNYGAQEPIEALKSDIQTFLASDPDLSLEDTYVQTYRSEEDIEFLPLTLPFEVVSSFSAFSVAPENLKHRLEFQILSQDESQEFLTYTPSVSSLANQEITLEYNPATPEDGITIASFPTIYDVVPLSLVNVRPVIKINGVPFGIDPVGNTSSLGRENKLKIIFKSPKKEIGGSVSEKIVGTIEKTAIAGNTEGISINTDYIAPPEIRPSADTQTISAVASQKLWKTAQNFLYRLQSSHDELARLTGGRFTNAATRAIVFNGVAVNYQSGEPYSFDWQGLRIDASSVVNYYSHFSQDPELHQKEFMYLFGLQASLDEADIFEDDYQVESISTTKGLKLINQNQIPGVQVKKITSANESEINSLAISESTKTKLRDAVHQDHVVYVPNAQFTYESWTGLVYIDIDPDTGFGSYIIGEGLNGGYTVEQWPDGLRNFLISGVSNLTSTIIWPAEGSEIIKGHSIYWNARYDGTVPVLGIPVSWVETGSIDTKNWNPGPITLWSGYGTNASVDIIVSGLTQAENLDCVASLEGRTLPATSGGIGKEMHLPLRINKASGSYRTRWYGKVQYNDQDNIYTHPNAHDFFTELFGSLMTVNNNNNPWIDSTITSTDHYWDMSITFGAFVKPALNEDHERYYMNMRWSYGGTKDWWFGKKVWIKNPVTNKAVVAGILEWGPATSTGRFAGASPEAMYAIGANNDDNLQYCWVADQNVAYGSVVNY